MPCHAADGRCPISAPALDNTQSRSSTASLLWRILENQEELLEHTRSRDAILKQLLETQQTILSRLDEKQTKQPMIRTTTEIRNDMRPPVQPPSVLSNPQQPVKVEDFRSFCEVARRKASSIGHFACIITQRLFSKEERVGRNCTGRRGKEALDAVKLEEVKKAILEFYSVPPEKHMEVWKESICRIDEMLRRKPRKGGLVPSSH